MQAPKNLIRLIPDLDLLVERIEADPTLLTSFTYHPEDFGPRRAARRRDKEPCAGAVVEVEQVQVPDITARDLLVEAGARAVRKISKHGEQAELEPDEITGLEAIVQIEGRPAILIQEGHFFPPPVSWQILEQSRQSIETNCKSVGRIELKGHPSLDWVGTGFLVADEVIMTNRHVAKEFCTMGSRKRWTVDAGITARIDYVEEMATVDSAEFVLKKIIGVHENLDMALFRVEKISSDGDNCPEPLPVSSKPPDQGVGCRIYCVGYPAWDGRRNDPEIMRKIFSNIFDVKRLQPGELMQVIEAEKIFMHDCSTLGGNSGSCVIDLQTGQVIGLHFGGRYQQGNYAVALWQLAGDPLLKKAKINFI
jgi:hypothetical protein